MNEMTTNHTNATLNVSNAPLKKTKPFERKSAPKLCIFEFTDYRLFMKEAFEAKRALNPSFSESALVRKAGLSQSSRGYFKRVVQAERNLTASTIRSFSEALGLGAKENIYFENLVHFNQARNSKDKEYFLQRLIASAEGNLTDQFELLKSQHNYYSHWYMVAVRELIALHGFQEDAAWITQQLRNKITKKEATDALFHLEKLGMTQRNAQGKLQQAEPLVKYPGNIFNSTIQKFHGEMLDRAKESLHEDDYTERRASCLTLSCDHQVINQLYEEIDKFRDAMNLKFGNIAKEPDTIIQVGFQVFQLTPLKAKPSSKKEIS